MCVFIKVPYFCLLKKDYTLVVPFLYPSSAAPIFSVPARAPVHFKKTKYCYACNQPAGGADY